MSMSLKRVKSVARTQVSTHRLEILLDCLKPTAQTLKSLKMVEKGGAISWTTQASTARIASLKPSLDQETSLRLRPIDQGSTNRWNTWLLARFTLRAGEREAEMDQFTWLETRPIVTKNRSRFWRSRFLVWRVIRSSYVEKFKSIRRSTRTM